MAEGFKDIIGKIDRLIDLAATEPKIEKSLKLRFIRSLLGIKLDLLAFLAEKNAAGAPVKKQVGSRTGKREKTEKKETSILKFIQERGGRAGMSELAQLGISGRSLRRYLNSLRNKDFIKVEKSGREHFYKLV